MWENLKTRHSLQAFALLLAACLSLSSCRPWESELEEIYEAAQNGDRLSQFAIIQEHKSFKDIVPEDTLYAYLWRFIREGRPEAFEIAEFMEWNKIPWGSKNHSEQIDKITLKWAKEGIKYNNPQSYERLGNHYKALYRKTHSVQDSLKAADFYAQAIEAGNVDLWLSRDIKAGIGAVITGSIQWGKYSYRHIFNDRSFIARLTLSCSYAYSYIVSGAIKLLFTKAWWKVLLTFLGMMIALIIPIMIPMLTIRATKIKNDTWNDGGFIRFGIQFGLWNHICFFVAMSNNNLVWLNNVHSLSFPVSAYGIQPYFPILMNWVALIYIVAMMFITFKEGKKSGEDTSDTARRAARRFTIFLVSYLMAQVGGVFIITVAILSMLVPFGIGVAKEAPGIIFDAILNPDSEPKKPKKFVGSFCKTCIHWNYSSNACRRDPVHEIPTSGDYDRCDNWSGELYQ